ncbi:MAG: RHS repeat-associated core domain-containing protein [Candidatus Methanofastidiosa archaeon]|nr:RHS repeat-associated core domain-containing protein [Candidatus Methanofastidiosa archaeon]
MKPSGNIKNFKSTHDYKPYGIELEPVGDDTTNPNYKYTGQERDIFTNYDYMHFRYYGSTIGRFFKPDNKAGSLNRLILWNKYVYVSNNPICNVDLNGEMEIRAIDTTLGQKSINKEYVYGVTFSKRSGILQPLNPIRVMKWIGTAVKIWSAMLTGKPAKNESSGVSAVEGIFDKAHFEAKVKEKLESLMTEKKCKPIEGIVNSDIALKKEQLPMLQEAVDITVNQMIKEGKITDDEGEKIKESYDIESIAEKAKENAEILAKIISGSLEKLTL